MDDAGILTDSAGILKDSDWIRKDSEKFRNPRSAEWLSGPLIEALNKQCGQR